MTALPAFAQAALNSVEYRLSYAPQLPPARASFPDLLTLADAYQEIRELGYPVAARGIKDDATNLVEAWFEHEISRDEAQIQLNALLIRAELTLYAAIVEHAELMTAARASCARTAVDVDPVCGF